MATIQPHENFNAEEAARELHIAMKGLGKGLEALLGTDEEAVIRLLTSHTNDQRKDIKPVYLAMYGKVLEAELASELSGDLEHACLALLTPPHVYLARELRAAVKGLGTDEGALIEILLTKTNQEIKQLIATYESEFQRSLVDDVEGDTSGWFKRLLVSQLAAVREESHVVDPTKAHKDAAAIYEAGEGQWGTDESVFNSILCLRSFNQLKATFSKYSEITGKDIEESINKELSGDLRDGYLAIVKSIRDPPAFYAERLYKSMKGLGTDETTLTRVLVTRSEIDLEDIKATFLNTFGKSLSEYIIGDTSGYYRKLLLAIAGDK